ncbi:MAG TPA: septum formation initiator family protein [Pseudomonadales bacterium]|nr:septum formation initiator family protein [Pseudomonadales bacterium]
MISWNWVCAGLGLLLLVLQVMLWTGQGSVAEVVALQRQIRSFASANEELRERNRRLEVEVAELKNGLDSVEEMAREELGLVRQGETFYVLIKR